VVAKITSQQKLITRQVGNEAAEEVYWFADDAVNWYLIAEGDELTVVDAGLPTHWDLLQEGLDKLGYSVSDIKALILTHTDVDHIGFAERLRERDVPIWVHVNEHDDALAGGRSMPTRVLKHLWRPAMIRVMLAQMRAGAFSAPAISEVQTFEDGQELAVPGTPTTVHVPGHSVGQTAFWLADRRVLFVGDSLYTVDPLTGKGCDPMVGRFSEANIDQAKQSARVLAEFGEIAVLPGHGAPWEGNLGEVLKDKYT
jgi:glyoxylase-like metal-dependent hydrolase (beta-lactamase superfamily II)